MVQQIIDLNQDRGIGLFDPLTSSSWSNPAFYCRDLDNCGDNTHVALTQSFTLNSRFECANPVRALQYSKSALAALAAPAGTTLSEFAATIGGVAFNASTLTILTGLAAYVVAPDNAVATLTPIIRQMLGIAGTVPVLYRGTSFIVQSTSARNKRTIATVSFPQAYETQDNCGEAEGVQASISVSIEGFDVANCKAQLLWQQSVSMFASYLVYGDDGAASLSDFTPAVDDSAGFGSVSVGTAIPATSASCTGTNVAVDTIRINLSTNGPTTIGVASVP